MRISRNIVLVFLVFILNENLIGQVHIIKTNDANLYEYFTRSIDFDFKDTLPDGEYYYVLSDHWRNAKRLSLEEKTLIHGQYKDSLKTGEWRYYTFCYGRRDGDTRVLTMIVNYSNGKRDGYFVNRNCGYKVEEGHYLMGERHGFWFIYGPEEQLEYVALYLNGKFMYRSESNNPTKLLVR